MLVMALLSEQPCDFELHETQTTPVLLIVECLAQVGNTGGPQ